ncbi:MAG: MobF family relaxase [Planctomycetota bacterium]
MLRIAPPTRNLDQAQSYFIPGANRSAGDYYLPREGRGLWIGKGAHHLGLKGAIEKEHFDRLCENRHPYTGERLTLRTKPGRRIGLDVSFSVPKSVSVVWMALNDARLIDAMEDAAAAALHRMERQVASRVRRQGANHSSVTANWIAGMFTHHTARPSSSSQVPDPQLHLHAFVFNATNCPIEDRWKAIDPGKFHRDAPYYQAIFHSELAKRVRELGYPIERTGHAGWEIAVVDRPTIEIFSSRSKQIEALARRLGITDNHAKGRLGATSRLAKENAIDFEELRDAWLSILPEEAIQQIRDHGHLEGCSPMTPRQAVDFALEHGFERSSVLSGRRVVAETLKLAAGHVTVDEAEMALRNTPDLWTDTDDEGGWWVTTPQEYDREMALVRFAKNGRGRYAWLGEPMRVIHPRDGVKLNENQEAAVRSIWSSTNRVELLLGVAGTGKTTLMREAIAGLEAAGRKVMVLAPSAEASRGVLRNEGFELADTVAMFLKNRNLQTSIDPKVTGDTRDPVIWVDEASLLSVKQMQALFRVAVRLDARVVLSGDPLQHQSVEAGDSLRLLQNHAYLNPIRTSHILRQKGVYREAVEHLSKGQVGRGFEKLDRMGAVIEIPQNIAHSRIAQEYVKAVKQGKSVLVVSPTHSEGGKVTRRIRQALVEAGLVKPKGRVVEYHRDTQWTTSQKRQPENYEPGMVIRAHAKLASGLKARGSYRVVAQEGGQVLVLNERKRFAGLQPLPLDQAHRFSVHRSEAIPLAKGDWVRCNGNIKDRRGRAINNGSLLKVAGVNRRSLVLKPEGGGKTLRVPVDSGAFTHGYALTSHASQGRTVDRVLIAQSAESAPAASLEQLYVSVSRGREKVMLFTDDRQKLMQSVERSVARTSAIELFQRSDRQAHIELVRDRHLRRCIDQHKEAERQFKADRAYEKILEKRRDRYRGWGGMTYER